MLLSIREIFYSLLWYILVVGVVFTVVIALQLLLIVLSLSLLLPVNDCRGSESSSIVLCVLSTWSCSQTCPVSVSLGWLARFPKEAPIRHCLCSFCAPVSGTFHKALSDHRRINDPVHNFRASPAMFRHQCGSYWCATNSSRRSGRSRSSTLPWSFCSAACCG